MAKPKRRTFTDDQKRAILAELKTSSLADVAAKHNIWGSVIHGWTKKLGDPRKLKAAPVVAQEEPISRSLVVSEGHTLVMFGMENTRAARVVELPTRWAELLIETFEKGPI